MKDDLINYKRLVDFVHIQIIKISRNEWKWVYGEFYFALQIELA